MLLLLLLMKPILLLLRYMSLISLENVASMTFLFSFMAAVISPDSGVQASLIKETARGISNFCSLRSRRYKGQNEESRNLHLLGTVGADNLQVIRDDFRILAQFFPACIGFPNLDKDKVG